MIHFEAVIKIADTYGHDKITDDEIKEIITLNLEHDADIEVIDVISIERKS